MPEDPTITNFPGAPAPSPDMAQTREWHRDLSAVLQKMKAHNSSRERYQAACRVQEAVAWLEADLDALEHPVPIENPS